MKKSNIDICYMNFLDHLSCYLNDSK
jgi:hypothetical protein